MALVTEKRYSTKECKLQIHHDFGDLILQAVASVVIRDSTVHEPDFDQHQLEPNWINHDTFNFFYYRP